MAKEIRSQPGVSPAFGTKTGVPANHSSTKSGHVVTQAEGHTQQDDMLQNVPPPQDPNISGSPDMVPLHDPIAGPMSAWSENDDYKNFLFAGVEPEPSLNHHNSRFFRQIDNDYDDNGGIPEQAVGHARNEPDIARRSEMEEKRSDSFSTGPIIIRRL